MERISMKLFALVSFMFSLVYGGRIEVIILPSEACVAGAQWSVDGENWHNSSVEIEVSADSVTMQFKELPGWNKPGDMVVENPPGGAKSTLYVQYDRNRPEDCDVAMDLYIISGDVVRRRLSLLATEEGVDDYSAVEDSKVLGAFNENEVDGWIAVDDDMDMEDGLQWDCRRLRPTTTWHLVVNNPGGLVLYWGMDAVPPGCLAYLGVVGEDAPLTDMNRDSMLAVNSTGIVVLTVRIIVVDLQEREMHLKRGWNAMAADIELTLASGKKIMSMKPYRYDAARKGYVMANELVPYEAFWVFSKEGTVLHLLGRNSGTATVNLNRGWNFLSVKTELPTGVQAWAWIDGVYRLVETPLAGQVCWVYWDGR